MASDSTYVQFRMDRLIIFKQNQKNYGNEKDFQFNE
nr:MAG TPA: DNA binding protein [Bacteriophage sp.]